MITKTLKRLRNTRDLRAEIASLAAELVGNDSTGQLVITAPLIAADTARDEWQRLLAAFDAGVAVRMTLSMSPVSAETPASTRFTASGRFAVPLRRANFRYEVLRLLLSAQLHRQDPPTIRDLIEEIGASQTPIRQAIADMKAAGIIRPDQTGMLIRPQDVSQDVLARVGALPQTLRLRFARGAMDKSPATLLQRLSILSSSPLSPGWEHYCLSGVAVAQQEAPQIDLVGIPRLDFVVSVDRSARQFDASTIAQLDQGLEIEPNVLAPAPIVLTILRPVLLRSRQSSGTHLMWADPADVFLSLLDLGLREQALQYAQAIRK